MNNRWHRPWMDGRGEDFVHCNLYVCTFNVVTFHRLSYFWFYTFKTYRDIQTLLIIRCNPLCFAFLGNVAGAYQCSSVALSNHVTTGPTISMNFWSEIPWFPALASVDKLLRSINCFIMFFYFQFFSPQLWHLIFTCFMSFEADCSLRYARIDMVSDVCPAALECQAPIDWV